MMTVNQPKKWTTATLGEVAKIERTGVVPEQIGTGTTYVGLENIESGGRFVGVGPVKNGELASTKFSFSPRHVLYGKLRPYLAKIVCPDFEGVCSTDILPILPGAKLDRRYLCYFLRQPSMVEYATSRCTGANLPRLSPSTLEEFLIPLPPLPEQRRIADILDKADAIRRKRREASEQLSSLLQATFLEMFGDPIANPKHWSTSSFGDQVSLLEYGPRFYNEPYSPDGVRIVRITDLDFFGRLDFSAMPRMVVDDDVREKRRLVVGDIILARSGATVGKSALIEKDDPECIAGAYFIRLQFKPAVRPLFAKMVIDSKSIQQIIAKKSQQSAQQNFSGPGIRSLPLPLPPESLQKDFEQLWTRLKHSQKRNATLQKSCDDLFSTVVQRAFRGGL